MRKGALLAVALLAAGCDRGVNEAICAPPAGPPGGPRAVTPEQQDVTNECVWYWSYRLARAGGSIGEVADAVIGACWPAIERFEGMTARDQRREPDTGRAAAAFRRDALYRVAEARAGNCEAP